MTAKAERDETVARKLLRDHLTKHGGSGFQCKENADDPPDLVVKWANGDQWGVEVTRTYQQVEPFDESNFVSSEQVGAQLRAFAKQIEETTRSIRKRSYTICLEGPGRFSTWGNQASWKKWKKETEKKIRKHIASEKSNPLKVPGVWLQPSEPGKRWTISVRAGPEEIGSATCRMIWRALEGKAKDLSKWNGSFTERWLLLLNFYPLAEDPSQVENILHQLILAHWKELAGFDGVFFWSRSLDPPLSRISLRSSGGQRDPDLRADSILSEGR